MPDDDIEWTKIYFDLPDHWAADGETVWATPLGDDLYRIENVLFHAYGVHYLDVVRATANEDDILQVREVVERSGHDTFRIVFLEGLKRKDQDPILDVLEPLNVSFERNTQSHLAIDVHPEADYDAVRTKLEELSAAGVLDYETCDTRVAGTFDDVPDVDV